MMNMSEDVLMTLAEKRSSFSILDQSSGDDWNPFLFVREAERAQSFFLYYLFRRRVMSSSC